MALFQNKRTAGAPNSSEAPLRSISAERLAALSELDLYDLFLTEQYAQLDRETRLRALQEVEDRRAKIDGREPLTVMIGDDDDFLDDASLYGRHIDFYKSIEISIFFFWGSSMRYSGAEALATLLHEGRHAAQYDLMDNRPEQLSLQTLMEWRSRLVDDFTEGDPPAKWRGVLFQLYQLRPLEMDARRFARRQMDAIAKQYSDRRGAVPESLLRQIKHLYNEEVQLIQQVKSDFSMALLDEIDKITVDKLQKRYPNLDLSSLRLFDHARIVLNTPLDKIENYEEIIEKMDRLADEHMDRSTDRLRDDIRGDRIRDGRSLT